MTGEKKLSHYLDDLPAIYHPDSTEGSDFLGLFLLAFEHVLTGVGDPEDPGLEETLEGIVAENGDVKLAGAHRYFTPGPEKNPNLQAPEEFLEWLSGWVALTLRDDWDEDERRRMLAEIVPSYSKRGTLEGLTRILSAFAGTDSTIAIAELMQPFQIGPKLTVGKTTVLGEGPPHYFMVRAQVPGTRDLGRKRSALRAIIDMEKPAHTYYDLLIENPTMQIGVAATVGKNTVLGIL